MNPSGFNINFCYSCDIIQANTGIIFSFNKELTIIATANNCNYVEGASFPLISSLSYDSASTPMAMVDDLTLGWTPTSTDGSCSINSCEIKASGCTSTYAGTNLSVSSF